MVLTLIGFSKGEPKVYRLIAQHKDEKGQFSYKKIQKTEQMLQSDLASGKYTVSNVAIGDDKKLKGTTGSLERFSNGINQPLVVLSEVVDDKDTVLGYKVCDFNGKVDRIHRDKLVDLCRTITKKGGIPIQNAVFVDDTKEKKAFIRSFPDCVFIKEVIIRKKSKHSVEAKVDTVESKKAVEGKLDDIFNADQIKQLKLGKSQGVAIKKFGNPNISAEKMCELREIELLDFNCSLFADERYTVDALKTYKEEIKFGVDVTQCMNPSYSTAQLFELFLGVSQGVDLTQFDNPNMDAFEMSSVRNRLASGLWTKVQVEEDPSWRS